MKQTKYITTIAQYAFLLLWGGTIALKLWGWQETVSQIQMQNFPDWLSKAVLWVLPPFYILLIYLLIYKPTVNIGIKLSTVLVSIFTLYLLAGVTKVFGYTPCACAGIWPTNDHWLHIALNSIFILTGIIYWILTHRSQAGRDVKPDLGREEGIVSS